MFYIIGIIVAITQLILRKIYRLQSVPNRISNRHIELEISPAFNESKSLLDRSNKLEAI